MTNKEFEIISEAIIRKAVSEDLDQLVAMQTAMISLDQELRPDDSRYEQVGEANKIWRQSAETKISDENSLILVAESNGTIVGYTMCWINERPPIFAQQKYDYLADSFVQESYRGRGLMRGFLNNITTWLNSHGIHYLELGVDSNNTNAIRVWQRYGFTEKTKLMGKEI